MLPYVGLVIILAFLVIWWYFKNVYSYWSDRKVVTPPYKYFFGNLGDSLILKRSTGAIYTDIYKEYKGFNYVGFYKFMQPGLLIRNPEIVKDVLMRNFNSFRDNDIDVDEKHDTIFGKNPFVLKGDKWKVTRGHITAGFSVSKMKQILPFLQINAQKMVKYLEKRSSNENGVEAKDLCSLFTAENTANCGFGVEANCFLDPKSEFKERGASMTKPSFWSGIKILIVMAIPSLSRMFKIKEYKGFNYVGFYKFMQPGLLIRNPEIVKDVLMRNFNSFRDNDIDVDEKHDTIFGKNPFVLKGDKWKVTRGHITAGFSVSKMKQILPFLQINAQKMVKYLEKRSSNENGVEAKDLCSLFTAENTANCGFGVEANCFLDPKSEFKERGASMTKPSFWSGIKILIVMAIPSLSRMFKIKFVSDENISFFRSIVKQTIQYRKENNVQKNDFMDYMLNTREKINDENVFGFKDIVAHVGGFFFDGYETSSIAISYTLYEIAAHVDVQEKLRSEIRNILKKHNGEFSYEAIQEMEYLDCVFKENLRKNVPLLAMSKSCTEPYTLPPIMEDNTGPEIRVEPGTPIIIPVYGLHMDKKYYPDPERFYPERFSGENKHHLKGLYLPFGDGPRVCLGSRFGTLQSKIAIASAVCNFEITVNKKTKEPLQLYHRHFMIAPVGGLWLNFKRI